MPLIKPILPCDHLLAHYASLAGRRRAQAAGATQQESPEERQQKALDEIYNLFTQAKAYAEAKPAGYQPAL